MLRSLFGRILSRDLELHAPLSRIMDFNLIAKPLGNTVQTWVYEIDIPLRLILKGMGKLKLLTK